MVAQPDVANLVVVVFEPEKDLAFEVLVQQEPHLFWLF
jgi:hypothetical protein